MAVVSIQPHAEFGPNDHREDAPHFIIFLDSIVSVSGNFGYVRNCDTGEQFTVRHGYSKKKTIFIPIIACFAFTAAIAMLLRY